MLAAERELLGFYISGHPLTAFRVGAEEVQPRGHREARTRWQPGTVTRIGGLVSQFQKRFTKKDQKPMAVFRLEHLDGAIEVIVFPERVRGLRRLPAGRSAGHGLRRTVQGPGPVQDQGGRDLPAEGRAQVLRGSSQHPHPRRRSSKKPSSGRSRNSSAGTPAIRPSRSACSSPPARRSSWTRTPRSRWPRPPSSCGTSSTSWARKASTCRSTGSRAGNPTAGASRGKQGRNEVQSLIPFPLASPALYP